MGFIEKLLSGVLTKALGKLFDKVMVWVKDLIRTKELVKRGEKYVEETEVRVATLEELQVKAAEEIRLSAIIDAETGEILQEGKVSDETKEQIRRAGRELIRGKRDSGRS